MTDVETTSRRGIARAPRRGSGDLRRRISVRVRAARLPPGRRLRPGGGAGAPRARDPAAPRIRPCGIGCRRGVHLLRPPREAPPSGQRAPPGRDEQAGVDAREERGPRERRPAGRRSEQHEHLHGRRRVAVRGARHVRGAGGLGRRGRRGFHHRRNLLVGRGSVDRARRRSSAQAPSRSSPLPRTRLAAPATGSRTKTRASASKTRARTSSG